MPKVKTTRGRHRQEMANGITCVAQPLKKSTPLAQRLVTALKAEYIKNTNPTKAERMKNYMREKFEFYGLQAPVRRDIDKTICGTFMIKELPTVKEVLKLAWQQEQREFHSFGVDFAIKHRNLLSGPDGSTCQESLDLVRHLLTTKSWWDTVDLLASSVVGHLGQKHPETVLPVLDRWIDDDNMWLRRTAILHQLSYKQNTDHQRLFRYCLKRCHENEFFIQKAIGWALRQYHRHNPEAVTEFVSEHEDKLAKLSVREALKHA